ncbi:unnamed protein product, partial [Oikopleura dioica]
KCHGPRSKRMTATKCFFGYSSVLERRQSSQPLIKCTLE